MPIVHIDPEVEMVSASTYWVYSQSGNAVPEELKKRIFMSWVQAGWVREEEGQMEFDF
ncbi:hypothetical protein [Brevibacillus borstelensis]|nr:hypothetical protein [Brevibacillus borstelensis]MED1885904.1 hypothetical protein [Brevibacillus borstelensis]WNF07245.1 hypothetical protein RFB14_07405 [Brevibacillus borstelensis]GED55863.1 hypothetical protein BBO01nite_51040 [Brevibacillus borstelensis]